MQAALNINTTPVALGFHGSNATQLWCTSATETLHTWGWADAAAEPEADFEDLTAEAPSATPVQMQHVLDARERLTSVAKGHAVSAGQVRGLERPSTLSDCMSVSDGVNKRPFATEH